MFSGLFRNSDTSLHFLARLELDHSAFWDYDGIEWFVGITSNTGFANTDFKYAKIPKLNIFNLDQTLGYLIHRFLNNGTNQLLRDFSFLGNTNN